MNIPDTPAELIAETSPPAFPVDGVVDVYREMLVVGADDEAEAMEDAVLKLMASVHGRSGLKPLWSSLRDAYDLMMEAKTVIATDEPKHIVINVPVRFLVYAIIIMAELMCIYLVR